MADTIFYTAVDGGVTGALGARRDIYAATVRNSDAHAWLNQKMAYATATATNKKNGNSATLALVTGGGIGGSGLYEPGRTSAGAFNPKPHINSVKIGSEGDFGSVLKCDISFTVYNLNDLDGKQAFFDLGAEVNVSYGWNRAGGAGGPAGNFKGFVYNFSYQVNPVGGFDCVCNAMGEGMAILGATSNPASDAKGKEIADALGNKVHGDTVMGALDVIVNGLTGQAEQIVGPDGVGNVKFPESWGTGAGEDGEEATPHYYVTLEAFVKLAVEKIHDTSAKLKDIAIKCDGTVTKGNVPTGGSDMLVSGNPKEILLPEPYATYGGKMKLGFTTHQGEFSGGDLSKIMISITHLNDIISKLADDKGNNAKAADTSIAKLFGKLFDSINLNTGTRFKLSMSQNPKNPMEFLIVDSNYIDATIQPFSIEAVTRGSICRSISLVAKVPSEMATAAYVGNTSTSSPSGAVMATINGVTEKDTPTKGDPAPSYLDARKKIDAQGPPDPKDPEGIGPSPKNVNALRAAIKRMYTSGETANGVKPGSEAFPVPIEFSCTLDGVNGFLFGNAITTNYLPSAYKKAKICFTVTKVEHSISQNDWTTTLSTVCRTQPSY